MNTYPSVCASRRSLLGALAFVFAARLACAVPAFPGAEGFGANATGGRGGSVYVVTNLNDSGAGSFRDAVSQPNRTVVFAVGGIIRVGTRIPVKANITIAGQTAPGDGITLYGNGVSFSDANNTIVRYMRFREGINGDSGSDCVGIASGDSMIFDHVSASWGRDETFSVSGTPSNITLQDCIIGEGLLLHSAGGLIQTSGGVSIFRCLYADNWMRNPKIKGVNDYINNVVYNWGDGGGYIPAGDSAGLTYANMISCYFIAGPNSGIGPFKTGNLNYNLYAANNLKDTNKNGVLDGDPVTESDFTTLQLVSTPFAYPTVAHLLTAEQAYHHIVTYAGASLHRDRVDSHIIDEVTSVGVQGAQIFNESEVGGPGPIAGGLAAVDTDGDGMPDWWEQAAGTNPLVADNNGDIDGDGYTNLENYLNSLVITGVPGAAFTGLASDTGVSSQDGITSSRALIFHGTAAAGSTVAFKRIGLGDIGSAIADGAGNWIFDYSGTLLSDGYYAFVATATSTDGKVWPTTPAFVVKVDTTPAAVPAISSIVASPTLTINGSSEPKNAVTVTLVGTGVIGTTTADELGHWALSYTGPALPPAAYSFTASAVDLAGNGGAGSSAYAVDTSLTPPTILAIDTDTGASTADHITKDTTLILNGTGPAGASLSMTRAGTGVVGSTTVDSAGKWSFDYTGTPLASGVYTFSAVASVGSNSSPASSDFKVTVDTQVPTVSSITRLSPTSAATTESALTYRVTFSEPVTGVDLADFSLTVAGATATLGAVTPISDSAYNITVNGATGDGTVRVDLKATGTGIADLAGNSIASGYTAGQTYTIRLAGSGVWTSSESGEVWSEVSDWENGVVAEGSGATADFGTLNLEADATVHLDAPHTLGRMIFGDADTSSPASWTLDNSGNAANTLTLAAASGVPSIVVNATGTAADADIAAAAAATPATIDVRLLSASGLTKSGLGTAILTEPSTITGPLNINAGYLKIGPGGSLSVPNVAIALSSEFHIAGGNFSSTDTVAITSGGSSGIVVSGGTANFNIINPSNGRNGLVKVTGGTLTANSLLFQRSGDVANMWGFGLVVQGGAATLGTVGLGTNNSWGAMSVEGGSLTLTGPLWVGWQVTAARGGQMRVTGGVFNSTDAIDGVVMSRKSGTNANNVAQAFFLGGMSTVEKFTLGYDSTVNAGSAAITVDGGSLYLGAGGLVKNGTGAFATTVTLNAGVLGAKNDWSTTVPLIVTGTSPFTIMAADAANAPHAIGLGGVLSGAGGLDKAGAGTLTLAAVNIFVGDLVIDNGAVVLTGSLSPGGSVAINTGGVLTGTGTSGKPIALNAGGMISPGVSTAPAALNGTSLVWNGGGKVALDLGTTSDQLVLNGTLTKGTAGAREIVFSPNGSLAVGTTYTLVTFASTDLTAGDLSYSGLGGNAGQFAVTPTSIQFTVTSGGASSAYADWADAYHLPVDQRAPSGDFDGDGLNNLLEFALALDPTRAGNSGISTEMVAVDGVDYPAIRYLRRSDLTGVTLTARAAVTPDFAVDLGVVPISATDKGDGTTEVVVRSTVPLSSQATQFLRVEAK